MKNNQHGFSAVEAVIVIVVVGLLGAVGLLMYSRQNANNTAQQPAPVATPPAKYLEIKEWKVRFKVPATAGDVTYSVYPPDPAPLSVTIKSSTVTSASHSTLSCATGGKEDVGLSRLKVGDLYPGGKGGYTASDLDAQVKKYGGAKLGDYYYVPNEPMYCNENAAALDGKDAKAKQARDVQVELTQALSTLQAVK